MKCADGGVRVKLDLGDELWLSVLRFQHRVRGSVDLRLTEDLRDFLWSATFDHVEAILEDAL